MDRTMISKQIRAVFQKYKILLFALVAGIFLMLIPEPQKTDAIPVPETTSAAEVTLEEKLAAILSDLEGAGKVKVLLTEQKGEEVQFQQDENISDKQDSQEARRDTVIITDSERSQTGLIQRVDPPIYQGAVVLCQGADIPTVKLAVIDAVSAVTGLDSTQISVLKMK